MANHPTTELWHVICRGGWEFGSYTTTFEYLLQLDVSLSVGGRALCGAMNSRAKLFPPSLSPIIDSTNAEIIEVLKFRLFDIGYKAGPIDSHLRSTCLASILMHLESFIRDFTDEHRIVKHITDVTRRLRFQDRGLTIADLIRWGNAIKTHWELENATATVKSIEQLSAQILSVEQRLILTQESLKSVSKEVHALTEAFQEFSLMMKDVVRYTRTREFVQSNATLTPVAHPSRESSTSGSGSKRSRFADLNSEMIIAASDDVPPVANQFS